MKPGFVAKLLANKITLITLQAYIILESLREQHAVCTTHSLPHLGLHDALHVSTPAIFARYQHTRGVHDAV